MTIDTVGSADLPISRNPAKRGFALRPARFHLEIQSTFWVGSQWGGASESDRRVGLNRMGKMTPDINPKLDSNPKSKIDRVVWAK